MTKTAPATNALTWQPRCPVNPNHGRLLDYENGFFCPHAGHNRDEQIPWWTATEVGAYDARQGATPA